MTSKTPTTKKPNPDLFALAWNVNQHGSTATMPLNLDVPLGDLLEKLEEAVPQSLAARGVPGTSIALIRDSACVWAGGFGIGNSDTNEPVRPKTIFEAYSLTKPILAYRALKMCDERLLELDRPLNEYLSQPYLDPGPKSDLVTLRMILSHTSGLSDNISDRKVRTPPGDCWRYSTGGYFYLQHVVDHICTMTFEDHTKESVLDPLGM